MALAIAATRGPLVERADERERLRQLLEAEFASQRFGLLARSWAYASLPTGLLVRLVVGGALGPGWAYPAVLVWGFTACLSLAFAVLTVAAQRRARAARGEGDATILHRPVAGERWLEAALLQLAGVTGAVQAVAALGPALLPAAMVTAGARAWGWNSVGAVLFLAVSALVQPSFAEVHSPLAR